MYLKEEEAAKELVDMAIDEEKEELTEAQKKEVIYIQFLKCLIFMIMLSLSAQIVWTSRALGLPVAPAWCGWTPTACDT